MSSATRKPFVIALILSIFVLYLFGEFFVVVSKGSIFVFPLGPVGPNGNEVIAAINICMGIDIFAWVIWALLFIYERDKKDN